MLESLLGAQRKAELELRVQVVVQRVRTHPIAGEVFEIIEGTLRDYVVGHGLMYSAAIAFFAILSLIPLIVLFASVAGYAFAWLGDSPDEMDTLIGDVMLQLRRVVPYLNDSFESDLRRIIENRGGLGLFSLGALLFTASQVFRALEYALAHVFSEVTPVVDDGEVSRASHRPRNVVVSKLLFGGFVATVLVLFLAVRFLLSLLKAFLDLLPATIGDLFSRILDAGGWAALGAEAVVIVAGFALLLKWFAGRRVMLRFCFAGGLVFWSLWHAARLLYEYYLEQWSDLGALYGSFTTIMVAVIWIFYSATLVMVCSHFVKAVQRRVLKGPVYPKAG